MQRPKRGDLVKIFITPKFDKLLKNAGVMFVGTVLECRYKTDAYYILPANSPLTTEPYWIAGSMVEVVRSV